MSEKTEKIRGIHDCMVPVSGERLHYQFGF